MFDQRALTYVIESESLQKRRATPKFVFYKKRFASKKTEKIYNTIKQNLEFFRYSIKGGFKFINKGENVMKGILTLK